MDKKFIIERQGKQFVLYAGLMALAHEKGLAGITTELMQIPDEHNNHVAIARAAVTMEREGKVQIYTGIGDASPRNVAPAMRECLPRFAETRAKARALRDAINITMTAFEELDGDGTEGPEPGRMERKEEKPAPAPKRNAKAAALSGSLEAGTISAQQRSAIENLCRALGVDAALFAEQNAGCGLAAMSEQQAQAAIMKLNEQREQKRQAA